ncbi:phytanoyl-CoA dioxygenase family protein [Streptosporangium sandarakinum]|uniref:phytanoyl-CoA dioxygenase family protein n=1 Tax=Streptosporangium sandarakinum TaxID=1260955 RepID=UPI003447FDE2
MVTYDRHYIDSFHTRGFIPRIKVKDEAEAEKVRQEWNALETREGLRGEAYSTTHSRHLDQRFVWELVRDPAILDAVEPLIGPDILLFGTRFFCKYGGDRHHRVSWHQDLDSWGLEPPIALTVWYAVDESDEGNGCMLVLPGSHRGRLREHDTSADAGNMLGRGQHLDLGEKEVAAAVPIVLAPGEISIHDGALVHASMPNESARRRCGLAIRYVPTRVRQRADLAKSPLSKAVLVRGRDDAMNFGANPPPFT